jgi:hypothetical protein
MAAIPYTQKYKDSKYQNPLDDMDPDLKQGKKKRTDENGEDMAHRFFREKCEYIYSCYLRDDAYIPYSATTDFRTNRLYAQGKQPPQKYKEQLTIKDKKTQLRKGWMNISWDILPILPKFRSLVLGKFDDIDYTVYTRAIDEASNTTREDIKMHVVIERKYGEMLQEFRSAIGIKEDEAMSGSANLPFIPKSLEELNMLSQMNAFRLSWEISMDKLMNDTAMKCNYPELKRRLMEDVVDLGFIAMQSTTDKQSNTPSMEYMDPEYLVVRQSRRNDYFDISEWGYIKWFTVAQLKDFGLNETQIYEAASAYTSMWGNPSMVGGNFGGGTDSRGSYDSFRIAVLDTEFQSFDRYFYESRMINDKEVFFDLSYPGEPSKKGNKVYPKQKQKLYRAKWIIGTSIVFDYGLQFDVPYDQEGKPMPSLHCYRVSDRSMINQCIASADDVQISVLKFRNAVAESSPNGLMVEWSSISNISHGGDTMSPYDILQIKKDRGDLIFKYAVNPANGMPLQGGVPPVTPLQGGIGPYLNELIQSLDWQINMIREITGINAVVDASTPQPGALVGTAKIAEAGTNYVLKPLLSGYKSVKSRLFGSICNRWQITAMYYKKEATTGGGPNAAFETIALGEEMYKPVFDVYCDVLISEEDKVKLDQACLESLRAAKTGSVGITPMDYFYIQQLVQVGNVRWAWVYLSYREKILTEEQQARAIETQKMQAEGVQKAKEMEVQGKLQEIKLMEEEKRKTLQFEYMLKKDLELAKIAATNKKQAQSAPAQ